MLGPSCLQHPPPFNDCDCAGGFSGLSLGAPAASSAPLFGTGFSLSASSASPAASPFGAQSASSAASVFGSQPASSAASVFGALPASSAASLFASSPGGSLFSQPSSAPVFGQQASAPGEALYSAHIQHSRVRSSWQSWIGTHHQLGDAAGAWKGCPACSMQLLLAAKAQLMIDVGDKHA